ncbi:MAG: DUF2911 domain-containing protein [Gemmatimonadales bacterium]
MIALLLALSSIVQDTSSLVVRIGTDTLSLEQYTRTATQLRGEYVIRSPRSLHRIYAADLNPDGSIRRLELVTHNIGGTPGPAETRMTMQFNGDSAVMSFPRGDSTATAKLAVPRGTMPFQLYVFGLIEQIGRMARASGKDSMRLTALTSANATSGAYVKRRGGDTLVIMFDEGQFAGVGPFTFTLDREGCLTWLTGKGSTLQVDVTRVPSLNIAQAAPLFANRPLGQLSPRDTVRATVNGAEVSIDYGRPMKRGREIFGNVVPWNAVWRTGANAATQLQTSADLTIGGATVPAGKYTLWTMPSPSGWQLIINKQIGQWGTEYNPAQDLVRVNAKVETLASPVEQFAIAVEAGQMTLAWDRTKVSVPVAKK